MPDATRALRIEPSPKRVRTYLAGQLVADTRHPVLVWEGPHYPVYYLPAADIQAARHAYGLDVPLGLQYVNYWRGLVHGDMGRSLRYNTNVGHIIAQAYPWTLELTVAALTVALCLAIRRNVVSTP